MRTRQCELEAGAARRRVGIQPDPSALSLDELTAHEQTETETAAAGVAITCFAKVLFEDPFAILGLHAAAGVLHSDEQALLVAASRSRRPLRRWA